MQYSISQSDNNACDILIEYAGGIKHINDYIHRLSIDFQPLGNRRRHALQLRGCIPQLEYSFRYGPTTENGWWKSCSPTRSWKTSLVADHDRYWNRCQQTERYVASQNRGRTQDWLFRRNADGMKTADNDAGLVILPDGRKYIAAFVMDIRDGWGQCEHHRPHITHGIWCDEMREARGYW